MCNILSTTPNNIEQQNITLPLHSVHNLFSKMYLKKTKQKDGRLYLSVADGYYDPQKGHTRTVNIEKIGYLDLGYATTITYYDVTNYYFEIDKQDKTRRKRVDKEHRPNPIVQMGLCMDNSGLPVATGYCTSFIFSSQFIFKNR